MLAKPSGPVHEYDAVPGSGVDADNVNGCPLQTAELLPATGAAGGFGSTSTTGAAASERHPFTITYMPE
jgi:hypothetical protein